MTLFYSSSAAFVHFDNKYNSVGRLIGFFESLEDLSPALKLMLLLLFKKKNDPNVIVSG